MQHVYCISGLGADERIFQKLEVAEVNFHYVLWLQPEPDETLENYARRLISQINHDSPVLLGVSFGGIIAIEISKIIAVSKVVLIASIKSHQELPFWMKACGQLKLNKLIPSRPLKSIRPLKALRPIQNYFLGATSEEEKRIANEYRDNVDPIYLKWSIKQVLNWKNEWQPESVFHLHGENDNIFPIKKVKPTHVIPAGGHFMVMNRYQQINEILRTIL